jgi:hypothetical protein
MYSQYYISSGEQTKMYTLRHQFEETVWFKGEGGEATSAVVMRDYYLRNLSTDSKKAVEVAKSLGFNVAEPKFTLDEIRRRTELEMEATRQAALEREEAFLITQKMKLDHEIQLVSEGKFPFGGKKGVDISVIYSEKGNGWVEYWMKQGRQSEGTIQALGAYLEANYKDIAKLTFMNKDGNGKYFGEPKEKMKDVEALHVESYGFDSRFGYTHVEKFITQTGELLVYMGSSVVDSNKGDNVKMNFTVKEHAEYDGVNQTKIIRLKFID